MLLFHHHAAIGRVDRRGGYHFIPGQTRRARRSGPGHHRVETNKATLTSRRHAGAKSKSSSPSLPKVIPSAQCSVLEEASAETPTGLDWMFPRRKPTGKKRKTSPLRRRLPASEERKRVQPTIRGLPCSRERGRGQLHVAAHEGAHRGTRIAHAADLAGIAEVAPPVGDHHQDFEKFIDSSRKAS